MYDNPDGYPPRGDRRIIDEGKGWILLASIFTLLLAVFATLKVLGMALTGHPYGYIISFTPLVGWVATVLVATWCLISLNRDDHTYRHFAQVLQRFAFIAGTIYLAFYGTIALVLLIL